MLRRLRGYAALTLSCSVAAAAVFAGCGGDDSSTSTAPAEGAATSASAEASTLPKKKIGLLATAGQAEIQQRVANAVKDGAKTLGWEVQYVDAVGDPAKMAQGLQGMVDSKVDAIIGVFLEPPAVEQALRAAEAAKIPVINTGLVGTPSPLVKEEIVADETANAKQLTARMVEDIKPGAEIGVLELPQFYGSGLRVKEFDAAAERDGLKVVGRHDVDLLNLFDDSTKAGKDMLNANPKIAAFFSCCDFGGSALAPAIDQARSKAKTYSFYAIPSVLPLIRDGKLVVVENDNGKTGLMALDQLASHFANGTPISAKAALEADPIKAQIVDESNVPPEGQEVFPVKDDVARYAEKWSKEYGLQG